MTDPVSPARSIRWIPLGVWALTVAGSVALILGARAADQTLQAGALDLGLVMFGVIAALFTSMGAAIEVRRPGNRVGWLMIASGPLLLVTFGGFLFGAVRAAELGQTDTVGGLFAWVGSMGIAPAVFVVGPLLALIFPDGRLPGPRWRTPVLVVVATIVATDLCAAFLPGPLQTDLPNNPVGIEALRSWAILRDASGVLLAVGEAGGVVLAIAAVTLRFRRSRGAEREQMKWFLAAIVAVGLTTPLSALDGSPTTSPFDFALIVSIGLVPVAVGIAVTRYRLYEIDTIINRAIVYGLLTAILAGGSAAAISVAQRLFQGVIGPGSDATIVLTTLIVVTAFDPIKKRLQTLVDRRLKEVRDPVATLDGFVGDIETTPWAIDRRRTLASLLRVVAGAVRADGGRAVLRLADGEMSETCGKPVGLGAPSLAVSGATGSLELTLGASGSVRAPDAELDRLRPAVERTLALLA